MLSIFHFHPFSANWLVDDGYGLLVRRFSQIETSLHFVGGFPMFDSRSAGAQQSRQINKTIKICHFHPGPTPLKGGYRKPMKHTWKAINVSVTTLLDLEKWCQVCGSLSPSQPKVGWHSTNGATFAVQHYDRLGRIRFIRRNQMSPEDLKELAFALHLLSMGRFLGWPDAWIFGIAWPGEVPEERAQSVTGAMLSCVPEWGIMSTLRPAPSSFLSRLAGSYSSFDENRAPWWHSLEVQSVTRGLSEHGESHGSSSFSPLEMRITIFWGEYSPSLCRPKKVPKSAW